MMTLESRCLESFPAWLRSLAEDARALAEVLESESAPRVHQCAALALTYLFKSLDLIPDGLEELGFVDDAFVMRAAAARLTDEERASDPGGTLVRLASDAALIAEFLGEEDYARLQSYVVTAGFATARGRSVEDVLEKPELRAELVAEVRQWAEAYATPGFETDEKNLIKLRSFLTTRLAAVT